MRKSHETSINYSYLDEGKIGLLSKSERKLRVEKYLKKKRERSLK